MYPFIGIFIVRDVVYFTEGVTMGEYYLGFIKNIFEGRLSLNNFLGTLFIGEFGLLTMVPIYIVRLQLPLVVGFYFLLLTGDRSVIGCLLN